jgi:uncharacterized protein (UPF0333 family)
MERQNLILAAVVILVVVLAFVIAMSLYGNNSFQKGQMSFQYPNAWAQDHVIGNFSQNTIYSEVTLKYTTGVTGQDASAFIIVSMQPKPQG